MKDSERFPGINFECGTSEVEERMASLIELRRGVWVRGWRITEAMLAALDEEEDDRR